MSLNGISTLADKAARKAAKLALAQAKRAATGTTGYRTNNQLLANPQATPLVLGRPWTSVAAIIPFTLTEIVDTNGASIEATNVGPLTLYAKSSTFQVSPNEDAVIKVNGGTIATISSRGHTLAVINPAGSTVGSITTYDTYGTNTSGLVAALNAVTVGNYVVLTVYDASQCDSNLRSVLTTKFGATKTDTWAPTRFSHIFIGKRV